MSQTFTRWRTFLTGAEAETYRSAGFGADRVVRFGSRPALLVVDCTLAFAGREGLTLGEAVQEFPTACGPVAWESLPHIARLLDEFRRRDLPVVYSRSDLALWPTLRGATKAGVRKGARTLESLRVGNEIVDVIAPTAQDLVLEKTKASVFFATPLANYLSAEEVDMVVVCGTTTSGCVRASVVDSFSHGFATFVVEEGCFDRSPTAHDANMWDMNAKYADVVTEAETIKALADL